MKLKDKGEVHKTIKVIANGMQILNGTECRRFYKVPIILLDYTTPSNTHAYAKGKRFALWIKLEEVDYKKIVKQLNPNLKEFTIWFDEENKEKLKQFLDKKSAPKIENNSKLSTSTGTSIEEINRIIKKREAEFRKKLEAKQTNL